MSIPSLAEYIYKRLVEDCSPEGYSQERLEEYINEYNLKYGWRKDTVWE